MRVSCLADAPSRRKSLASIYSVGSFDSENLSGDPPLRRPFRMLREWPVRLRVLAIEGFSLYYSLYYILTRCRPRP